MNKVYLVKEHLNNSDVVMAAFSEEDKANTYIKQNKLLSESEQWVESWLVDYHV